MKTFIAFISFLLLSSNGQINAQWSTDPGVNNAISTFDNDQYDPWIVSDGSGGAIITWTDNRNGVDSNDIYAQRVDANGVVQWTTDGVVISAANNRQTSPLSISDGSGGAIITWLDERNGSWFDIYTQRINANGVVQWEANGVAISTVINWQWLHNIVSDGSGGAIIIWTDYRNGRDSADIYAQRINAEGIVQWATNGVAVTNISGRQSGGWTISDGSGGAIIVWGDSRIDPLLSDLYAQRINSDGIVQWQSDGVEISTANGNERLPRIINDVQGGAIITWTDDRDGEDVENIYTQRINAGGTVQWNVNGVAITTTSVNQSNSQSVSDGSGGAIITWEDERNGSGDDIYAQRINASGVVQWTADGVAISTESDYQLIPWIISDGDGGAIITWEDSRFGIFSSDVYAQRVNFAGVIQWAQNGVPISTANNGQGYPLSVGDGQGGAIICWPDGRNGINADIYAQRVDASGNLGSLTSVENEVVPLGFALKQNYPNPFNPSTTINYKLQNNAYVSLTVFDILGNQIASLINKTQLAGEYNFTFDARLAEGQASSLSSGIYYYKLQAGTQSQTKKMILVK